jgi:hypothetical protein
MFHTTRRTATTAVALGAALLVTVSPAQATPTTTQAEETTSPTSTVGQPSGYLQMVTPDDCDGEGIVGKFKQVGSDASFPYNGRQVELQNESIFDRYSRAEIKSGRRTGDQVWVDRSYRQFSRSTKGIVSNAIAESQGWKKCGPFSGRTQSVRNDIYAARACAHLDGVTKCGKWYVD